VPANEVFMTSSKSHAKGNQNSSHSNDIDKLTKKGDQSGTRKRAMHIKRFDPSNPDSFALLIKKEEDQEKKKEIKEKNDMRDASRKYIEMKKQ
jgi:hypothetical protein